MEILCRFWLLCRGHLFTTHNITIANDHALTRPSSTSQVPKGFLGQLAVVSVSVLVAAVVVAVVAVSGVVRGLTTKRVRRGYLLLRERTVSPAHPHARGV